MKNKKFTIQKILRFLKITKPIKLDKNEVKIIKLCKRHDIENYKVKDSNFLELFKPLFEEIYDYDVDENYNNYLNTLFNILFDIYLKIQYDNSGTNNELKNIIYISFNKNIINNYENPMERVITELCILIQNNIVINKSVARYILD